ncbi:hypothetical protein [Mesorhizobium sp. M2D.F.Ca.ET.223.01.1.1]|nr:hypothetical protein [Mesorhizobium sp. M2D.F.Ca.ET.223.01.1.1]
MAEFRAFPAAWMLGRAYIGICLNKLIFRQLTRRLNPDFFWVQFGGAA